MHTQTNKNDEKENFYPQAIENSLLQNLRDFFSSHCIFLVKSNKITKTITITKQHTHKMMSSVNKIIENKTT